MLPAPLTRFVARDTPGAVIARLAFGDEFAQDVLPKLPNPELVYHFLAGRLLCAAWRHKFRGDRQRWTLIVAETLADPRDGEAVPDLSPHVLVHVRLVQHGPAGYGGPVDRFLELVNHIRSAGLNPAKISARYWREAAADIQAGIRPSDPSPDDHDNVRSPPCGA
ncbi:MAG TPA: hypothetical protein VN541_13075 [Tepidisphaeraceae bacterium]|nr:hypothetical protein [Tepidisphaeraceae bacterium]